MQLSISHWCNFNSLELLRCKNVIRLVFNLYASITLKSLNITSVPADIKLLE